MKLGEEDSESIKFYDWIIHKGYDAFCFHVANERKTNYMMGHLLKRKGVKKGVSDYFFLRASQGYHGLVIELKTNTGVLSKEQKEFLEVMNKEQYLALMCCSSDEAIKVVQGYLQKSS